MVHILETLMSATYSVVSPESDRLTTSLSEDQIVNTIGELWNSLQEKGLCVRHQIGAHLNDQCGSPEKRQKRGKGVLVRIRKELRISVSELNRMRWFAHLCPDRKDVQGGFSNATTWSRVKELLPTLKAQAGQRLRSGTANEGTRKAKKPSVRAAFKSLNASCDAIDRLGDQLVNGQRKRLLETVNRLVTVLKTRCGITLSLAEA
jgi:hypothetical protein